MTKYYVWMAVGSFIFLSACHSTGPKKSDRELAIEKITSFEKKVFNDSTSSYSHEHALKVIGEYSKFVKDFPQDSLSPKYLYMSGQLSKSINMPADAIRKFQALITQYPDNRNASKALFLTGMIYETELKDTMMARQVYTDFIVKYPNDDLVDDAKFLIQNLSLTDEQLIKMFEEKNKQTVQK
jgi:TolA-binding protein